MIMQGVGRERFPWPERGSKLGGSSSCRQHTTDKGGWGGELGLRD